MEITQEEAKTWAVGTRSIYDPTQTVVDKVGEINKGPIADFEAAHDVANVESTQGRDAALAREAALERQAKTGLTAEQEVIANFLREIKEKKNENGEPKYEHALQEFTDSNGNMYAVTYPERIPPKDEQTENNMGLPGNMVVFDMKNSEVLMVAYDRIAKNRTELPESIDWDGFSVQVDINKQRMKAGLDVTLEIGIKGLFGAVPERASRLDLRDERNLFALAKALKLSEEFGKKRLDEKVNQTLVLDGVVEKYF